MTVVQLVGGLVELLERMLEIPKVVNLAALTVEKMGRYWAVTSAWKLVALKARCWAGMSAVE